MRTDAEVITVLQRAWLLPKDGPVDSAVEAKFSLDSVVGDEGLLTQVDCQVMTQLKLLIGSNYSAGEKQLLALSRALVKNSRIIILVSFRVFKGASILSYLVIRTRPRVVWTSKLIRKFNVPSRRNLLPRLCFA